MESERAEDGRRTETEEGPLNKFPAKVTAPHCISVDVDVGRTISTAAVVAVAYFRAE